MSRATIVATIKSLSRISEARNGLDWKLADWLEIRADLMPEPDPIAVRPSFDGRLLYSLRAAEQEGGTILQSAHVTGVFGRPPGASISSIWKVNKTLCQKR